MSDKSGAQEEHEVRKWAEGMVNVGNVCHIWMHRTGSTVVQIILRNVNGENFRTESI